MIKYIKMKIHHINTQVNCFSFLNYLQIVRQMEKTAENFVKYLGGSEDTFIAKMYSEFYKINWNDESKYKTDEKNLLILN